MTDNFDALWLYEPEVRYTQSQYTSGRQFGKSAISESITRAMTNTEPGAYWPIVTTSPGSSHLKDLLRNYTAGGIPPKTKEKTAMGYSNDDHRSDSQKIDDAVREAIAKPRREAEIAKRIAAVTALETLKDVAVGTVVTFTRKNGRGDKADFTYAALKTGEDRWAVTGDGYRSNGDMQTFDGLLSWLTTGDTLAENVQTATAFSPLGTSAK